MKYFDKNVAEFTVIFLHTPSACCKCSSPEQRTVEIGEAGGYVVSPKKLTRKINRNGQYFLASTPVKDISKKLAFRIGVKEHLNFKKSFENFSISGSPPKKAKTKKNMKTLSSQTDKYSFFKNSKAGKKIKNVAVDKSASPKKQSSSDKKIDDTKAPGKGTLKRKRWYFNKLNTSNDNYEDDIFENEKFGHFQNLLEDETDNCEQYEGLKTPVFPFSTSPRVESPSPTYKDCYSPTELSISRKDAEEYHYRMNSRRKKYLFQDKKKDASKPKNEKKKDSDVQKTLEEVARILNERQNMLDRSDSEDDDQYFSDILNASPTLVS